MDAHLPPHTWANETSEKILSELTSEIEGIYARLSERLGREPNRQELSNGLGLSESQFKRALVQVFGLGVGRFLKRGASRLAYCPDGKETLPELSSRTLQLLLTVCIDELRPFEKLVLSLHYCEHLTLNEVAMVLQARPQLIWEVHTQAILYLRGKLQRDIGADPSRML